MLKTFFLRWINIFHLFYIFLERKNIINNLNHIFFINRIILVFCYEYIIYCIYNDYKNMIIKLTNHLSMENILYVKMFQAIALNNTWIDEELNQYLLKFTDNAPYDNNDIDWETIEYIMKLGNFTFSSDASFFKPINSGMISIVYILQNQKTKEKFILKLKRVDIEKKINDGIQKIIFLINVLSFLPIIKQYHIQDILQKNIKDIYEQTNFNQEIKNMKLLKEKYKNLKYVKIPDVFDFKDKIIDDKYKNKFIIMEHINGYNITTLPEEYYETYAKLVLKFAFASVFNFGITHGDLHSGNIIFIKDTNNTNNSDNKDKFLLGLIDFGILLKINEDMKYLFIDIFTELFEVSPIETAKKLINPIILEPKNVLDKMTSEQHNHIINMCAEIIKNIISESTNINQIHFYETVKKINDYLNGEKISELGLKPSDDFIKLQLAIAMSHGITLKLCKKNYINITKTVLQEMFYI